MKLTILTLIILFTCSLSAQDAKVQFLIGEVNLKESSHQKDWMPLGLNDRLLEKNIVRTGKESRCELLFPDGSVVKILDFSMMQIKFVAKPEKPKTDLFALIGKFFFNVKKMASQEFRVKSPASVAAIRGTEFYLNNTASESELWVKSGSVVFSDLGEKQSVTIPAGKKSFIKAGGRAPSTPVDLTPSEKKALESISVAESKGQPNQPKEKPMVKKSESKPPTPSPTKIETEPEPTYDEPSKKSDEGFAMGLALGAVSIDNKLYNQIGLRPAFSIGKLGVALDLTMYIDEDGEIYKDNWDSADDILEKIYYIRWAKKGDPFYAKVGAIDNYKLGYGLLVNHYYNTIEYPTVIRTGLELGVQTESIGLDVMMNDFKELGRPGGLFAGRLSYKLFGDLEIGASVVYDRNQFASLGDKDDDGVPDELDDFPNDKNFSVDSDEDGIPDETDPDRDGNGYTDNDPINNNDNDFDESKLKVDPFNMKDANDTEQIAYAIDIGYPVMQSEYLKLILYGQAAKFGNKGGWGIAAPGFLAKLAFIDFYGEYRIFDKKFMPEYFNSTYELERAVFRQDTTGNLTAITKRELLESIDEKLQGFVIGADFNISDLVIFRAEYQNMRKAEFKFNTLRTYLDLNTQFIPNVESAGVYYTQQNVKKIFSKQEGTVLGARLQYSIAEGSSLVFDYRQAYRDLNGDGKISGSDEFVTSTNIQTVFTF